MDTEEIPANQLGPHGFPFTQTASPVHASSYQRVAEDVAARVAEGQLLCSQTTGVECAHAWLTDKGASLMRRPLDAREIDVLLNLYQSTRDAGESHSKAMRVVIEATLQLPECLYRAEAESANGRLNSFDIAERLSMVLWRSVPDQELLGAATTDSLRTPAQIRRQVDRMLQNPKAGRMVESFAADWLHLPRFTSLTKPASLYPEFNETLANSMTQELKRFLKTRHSRGTERSSVTGSRQL